MFGLLLLLQFKQLIQKGHGFLKNALIVVLKSQGDIRMHTVRSQPPTMTYFTGAL